MAKGQILNPLVLKFSKIYWTFRPKTQRIFPKNVYFHPFFAKFPSFVAFSSIYLFFSPPSCHFPPFPRYPLVCFFLNRGGERAWTSTTLQVRVCSTRLRITFYVTNSYLYSPHSSLSKTSLQPSRPKFRRSLLFTLISSKQNIS